jgi:hypothetical protein
MERGDDRWRWRGDKQCRESPVIESQLCGTRKRLAASQPLRSREQNLFLHADVLEQARAELSVSRTVDFAWDN